jgi:hypothetical protein
MTRKDYIKFAKAIKNNKQDIESLLNELCKIFEEDNSNFDRDRFIEAVNS